MSQSTVVKIALVGLAALSMAACTPRRPVTGATDGTGGAVANNPVYPGPGNGGIDGGATGPAAMGSEQDFVVNVGDRIYFDLDSYQVSPEAYPRLDAQAAWLQRYPQVQVRIEGNADERGTREYNLALGARRAESIRNYLIDRGVPAGRIDTISFGKERPIAQGANEDAWARNRNGHTAIVTGAN
ncbi:peptidoglycan-associated lipoprotein Pal [Brevundimonas subvibrioides]|uniref:Peptidoglycan-associated protein n=1 Tax=Brevundimonas subvibrioides (strain ATCC 15264 / DSM 4735 / LMG 14903 / NBRC 16000 / CB 81) TaxID=633149 RepID=D9QMK8_BRESC|nr:peptidoglycan-associated lipoprotein Pal [Brevundimonas subvibrioides]ADL00178.1 peptidoglycan-associated lipoprotein [Brevundimonas subvibrioides ATCC 15264]